MHKGLKSSNLLVLFSALRRLFAAKWTKVSDFRRFCIE